MVRFVLRWSDLLFHKIFGGLIWFLWVLCGSYLIFEGGWCLLYCFSFFFQLVGWCGSGFGFVIWLYFGGWGLRLWVVMTVVVVIVVNVAVVEWISRLVGCGGCWLMNFFIFFFFGGDWQWLGLNWIDLFQLIN